MPSRPYPEDAPDPGDAEGRGDAEDRREAEDPEDRREAEDPEERESAYALLQRGSELLSGRHHAQAAIVLERAARLEPRKGSILEALARAYYNSGQHDRAATTFEALLEVDPSNHYGQMGMGLSLERLGRMREARTHLRLALAMSPGNEQYRRTLDRVSRKAAREEREAAAAEEARGAATEEARGAATEEPQGEGEGPPKGKPPQGEAPKRKRPEGGPSAGEA